jgi:hypothetical protein
MSDLFRREPFKKWCEEHKDQVMKIVGDIWDTEIALKMIEADFGILFDMFKEKQKFSTVRDKSQKLFHRMMCYESNTDNKHLYSFDTLFNSSALKIVFRG